MFPIVFINLERDIERRQRLETEFHELNLTAQRLNAVLWTELPEQEQSQLYSKNLNQVSYHSVLTNGEKGCYASHIRAWQALLSSNFPAMIVLEDDARLDSRFKMMITAIKALTVPWDMVKLIGRPRQEKFRAARSLCEDFDLIEYSRVPSSTAAYVISRAGAKKLLDSRQPFGRPVDVDLRFWWENDLQIFGVMPSVVKVAPNDTSSIGRRNHDRLRRWRRLKMKTELTVLNWISLWRRGHLI